MSPCLTNEYELKGWSEHISRALCQYFEEVKNQTVFHFPFIAILAIALVSVTEVEVKPNAPLPDLRNLSVPVSNRLDLNYLGINSLRNINRDRLPWAQVLSLSFRFLSFFLFYKI